jgi:hypothetical protein
MAHDQRFPIETRFKYTTARWVEQHPEDPNLTTGEYVDHKVRTEERTVAVEFTWDAKMKFHGGPTGHESYHITPRLMQDLQKLAEKGEKFCICAGTINSWPECSVPAKVVVDAFDEAFGIVRAAPPAKPRPISELVDEEEARVLRRGS